MSCVALPAAATIEQYQSWYECDGLGIETIAEKLSCSKQKVSNDLRRAGITLRPRNWARDRIGKQELTELYAQGLSIYAISKQTGLGTTKLGKDLRRFGIKARKGGRGKPLLGSTYPNIDLGIIEMPQKHDALDAINSDESAYCLGLLWADGCIRNQWRVSLGLQERDLTLVQRMQRFLGGKLSLRAPQKPGHQALVRLDVDSKQLVTALRKQGMCERKDFVLPKPALPPKEFSTAFVRGLIDGDGMVAFQSGGIPMVTFANRNAGLRKIVCDKFFELSGDHPAERENYGDGYGLVRARAVPSAVIAKALYLTDETAPALPRKREEAQQFLRWLTRRSARAA